MEKLIVEKINKTNEYYEEQWVYLELNKGKIFIYKKYVSKS